MRTTPAGFDRLAAEQATILGQLTEGVIVTDKAGRIIFVNDAAARIHGVSRLDVAPENYSDTYHLLTLDGHPYPTEDLPLARAVLKGETVINARWCRGSPRARCRSAFWPSHSTWHCLPLPSISRCWKIASEKRGRSRWCWLVRPRFEEAANWMEAERRRWTERLDRLEDFLDKTGEN